MAKTKIIVNYSCNHDGNKLDPIREVFYVVIDVKEKECFCLINPETSKPIRTLMNKRYETEEIKPE